MMFERVLLLSAILAVGIFPTLPARAAMLDEYYAFIGEDDLYNSRGVRLGEPWQVIRRDRANFYRYGIRQRGDEADGFFSSIRNRDAAERMLARGSIDPVVARMIVDGGVLIRVRIFGHGAVGDYLEVTIAR